ncbi:MAG: hypothetical protein ACP6KW_08270 [Candidatus Thorarchaeota archaeon]
MPTKELEKLGGLFDTVTGRSKPFQEKCSKTKLLAVKDYALASSECIKLAKQTLDVNGPGFNSSSLDKARAAIESGQLDSSVVNALQRVRSSYVESVLKPAVRSFLQSEEKTITDLEALYLNALKIEGLLEVVQFLTKVQPKKV